MFARLAQAFRFLLLLLGALACIATPAQRFERNYPLWEFQAQPIANVPIKLSAGCTTLEVWVSKSGKEGIGLSFELRNSGQASCPVYFTGAWFTVGSQTVTAAKLPTPLEIGPEGPEGFVDAYLGFPFDNEAAWNAGERNGALHLRLVVGGEIVNFDLPMSHELHGFQKQRYPEARKRP